MDLVLGIDGGGTKTAAWLSTVGECAEEKPLGCGSAGPGNPRAVGFEIAFANILAAVEAAFADADMPRTTVRAACLALAGADRAAERSRLEKWCVEQNLAERLVLTNDAEPLLAAASQENCGIALISGTGSFAFGRDRNGQTARCGGWGYLFGDEGSGYAIALSGLQAAARAADGRGEPTQLLARFQQRLGASTPQGLVEAIYRPEFSRQQIAELADVVFDVEREGDLTARQLILSSAAQLAELVQTLAHKLQFSSEKFPLAVAGGMLLHYDRLRMTVAEQLAQRGIVPASTTLIPDPVRGAVVLARHACGKV